MKNRILKKICSMIKKLSRDNEGAAVTILILFILPMLVFGTVSLVENTNILRASNTTLQNAVTVISRQAAMMINEESQAKGDPLIAHKKANQSVIEEMNYTLGQYMETGTTLDNVQYWMLVYNGRNTYQTFTYNEENFAFSEMEAKYESGNDGIDEVVSYAYYSNGFLVEASDAIVGTQTFHVDDKGIHENATDNSVKVTLNDPGVLLVINADINPLMVEQSENATRWAYAKIVKR